MAVCAITKAFRQLSIFKKEIISYYSTHSVVTRTANIAATIVQVDKSLTKTVQEHVTFGLRSIDLNNQIPRGGALPLRKIIESPLKPHFIIENPITINFEKNDIAPNKIIETPTNNNVVEKQAHRMIKIRRKKMKKHQRRKWLKRFKFVIRKRRQRKNIWKEKLFQAELQEMIMKAEQFDPKKYVAERLEVLTRERIPNKWRGEILPEEMVRQFMKEKEERKAHKRRLMTYRLKLDN